MLLRYRKNTRILLLIVSLVICYGTFFTVAPSVNLLTAKYHDQVTVTFHMLYRLLSESDLHLDTDREFIRKFRMITNTTLESDPSNNLFFLKEGYKPPTSVTIPAYFQENDASKPLVQRSKIYIGCLLRVVQE